MGSTSKNKLVKTTAMIMNISCSVKAFLVLFLVFRGREKIFETKWTGARFPRLNQSEIVQVNDGGAALTLW